MPIKYSNEEQDCRADAITKEIKQNWYIANAVGGGAGVAIGAALGKIAIGVAIGPGLGIIAGILLWKCQRTK